MTTPAPTGGRPLRQAALPGCSAAALCSICVAGCATLCEQDGTGTCGHLLVAAGVVQPLLVPRPSEPPLPLMVIAPAGPSNRTAVLVVHDTSLETTGAAAEEAFEWARRYGPDGYTIVAVAYREADSAYGQHDLRETLEAVDWLAEEGGRALGMDSVILFGGSRGAIVAFNVAFRVGPDKLAGIIARSGASNLPLLAENPLPYLLGLHWQPIQRSTVLTLQWLGVWPFLDP